MDPDIAVPENWTAPRELSRALPREVRMTAAGTAVAAMLVLMAIGGIAFFVFVRNVKARQAAHIEMLRTQGEDAPGTVLRLWRADKSNTPTMSYAFTAGGRRFEGESSAPAVDWDGLRVGDTLPIRFVPTDPAINHPASWSDQPPPGWVAYMLPAILVVCIPLLGSKLRRQGALLAEGLAAPGVVTGSSRTKGGWVVRYRFRTKGAEVIKGRAQWKRRPPDGEMLCVLYDPEKPRRNKPYPMGWYRLA
jgi:Protein of unknown function (DUF3592)